MQSEFETVIAYSMLLESATLCILGGTYGLVGGEPDAGGRGAKSKLNVMKSASEDGCVKR